MDPSDQKRFERFEDKLDDIKDKLSAFPVVGQRLDEQNRRIGNIEDEIHELRMLATENKVSNAKLFTIASVAAVVGSVALRWAVQSIGL